MLLSVPAQKGVFVTLLVQEAFERCHLNVAALTFIGMSQKFPVLVTRHQYFCDSSGKLRNYSGLRNVASEIGIQ
jgi:hypothetical protein